MTRRLVVTDVDGTLLDSSGHVRDATRSMVRRLLAHDWPFVLATARPVNAVRPVVEELGHAGLVVCSNGCLAYDFSSQKILDDRPIAEALVRRAVAVLRRDQPRARFGAERGLDVIVESDFVFEKVGAEAVLPVRRLESALDRRGVGKILVQLPGDALEYRGFLASRLPAGFEVTASAPEFCEVTLAGVTKGSAVRDLTASLGFRSDEVVAFGDMPNDVPMLTWAGTGVAVANAHPEVLAVADAVTLGNDEDGVAAYVAMLLDAEHAAHPGSNAPRPARPEYVGDTAVAGVRGARLGGGCAAVAGR